MEAQPASSSNHQDSAAFRIVDVRAQLFDKFPSELKCQLVYRHFYTDMDEEASQLSLQWFALLISYFCALCRLEGRRVQYTSNGQSERFGAEFARAHQRTSILFERVTSTYRRILLRYNVHSKISIRKREGPRVIVEQYKLQFKYADGVKCDIEKHSHKKEWAFLYALDEMRFHEELVTFSIQMMKRAFTDERLQQPIVQEMTRLFRSRAFSFQNRAREGVVSETQKSLEEARGVTSILHNCHLLASRLVAPTEHVPLKLALRQRTPFVASALSHPLLTTLSYQRAFARMEVEKPTHATYHVRLAEGEESPHRKEMRELTHALDAVRLGRSNKNNNNMRFSKEVQIPSSRRRKGSRSPPKNNTTSPTRKRSPSSRSRSPRQQRSGTTPPPRASSVSTTHQQHRRGEPAPPTSKAYWERVGTSKEEEDFTVETHQPMFSPSHRALSSLTPVAVIRAHQQLQKEKAAHDLRETQMTVNPGDSKLPRLFDFDRAAAEEADAPLLGGADGAHHQPPIDHATEILYGRGSPLGQSPGRKPPKMPLGARFSTVAKRVAKASGVKTTEELQKRTEKKAVDRLVSAAASAACMSEKSRRHIALSDGAGGDPSLFFVAPIDPSTGTEDFTLYDPTADIDAVYQQLAHGVHLSHFSIPLDIGCDYDATGLLIAKS